MAWIEPEGCRVVWYLEGKKRAWYKVPKAELPRAIEAHNVMVAGLSEAEAKVLTPERLGAMVNELLRLPRREWLAVIRSSAPGLRSAMQSTATFEEVVDAWLAHALTSRRPGMHPVLKRTAERFKRWGAEIGVRLSDDLTAEHCQNYHGWRVAHRDDGRVVSSMSARIMRFEIGCLRDALHLAKARRVVEYGDQADGVSTAGTRRVVAELTDVEQRELLEALARLPDKWPLHAALAMLCTGMRAGELQRTARKDWHPAEGFVQIHGGKTEAARRKAPLPKGTGKKLLAAGLVFQPVKDFALELDKTLKKYGFAAHRLRHSAASNWRRAGRYSIDVVADHLGHVDMAFTRTRYSKAGREAEQFAAIRKRYQKLLEWLDDCPLL